jgi:hypothetical protein
MLRAEAAVEHPKDIKEIKKQIYDLEIEYVEDIPMSTALSKETLTKDFWQGGWASVDDSKEEVNGFKLEPQEDGSHILPDRTTRPIPIEAPRTYTYHR